MTSESGFLPVKMDMSQSRSILEPELSFIHSNENVSPSHGCQRSFHTDDIILHSTADSGSCGRLPTNLKLMLRELCQ